MPEYVQNNIQAGIDHIYEMFVSKVSENRKMKYEDVLPIAGGRIWSGNKALELGLIDKIGGLKDAIESAAKQAGVEDFTVKNYKKP